ncbi:hypothetical protein [Tessaracoccus caeni]|uniref:hypothetical protein n=1 Tax=Tessaracoccus caeni TaxID=3031239 RepID=UPI0023DB98BB|nr:hypothetical protein [Tessaracoccus caeni]MDF1487316.1 hypothetical protein [Tessaracoccus caeni]
MRKLLSAVLAGLAIAGFASSAHALPTAPEPVAPLEGIPAPCASTHEWPEDASIAKIKKAFTKNFGFELTGDQWTKKNLHSIKILWETFDAVECTDYRKTLQKKVDGNVGVNAAAISGYAWGDWSLSKGNHVSLDFSKFQRALDAGDEGRLVRLVAHEFAHVWNSDRHSNPAYWQDFKKLYRAEGKFSSYADNDSETFADAVGYYVGRCALDNPYDTGEHDAYYDFVKDVVFDGREFGPEPGVKPDCTIPDADAEVPATGLAETPDWVSALAGE